MRRRQAPDAETNCNDVRESLMERLELHWDSGAIRLKNPDAQSMDYWRFFIQKGTCIAKKCLLGVHLVCGNDSMIGVRLVASDLNRAERSGRQKV